MADCRVVLTNSASASARLWISTAMLMASPSRTAPTRNDVVRRPCRGRASLCTASLCTASLCTISLCAAWLSSAPASGLLASLSLGAMFLSQVNSTAAHQRACSARLVPSMEQGEDRWYEDQRGHGGQQQSADYGATQRRILLAA